MNLDGVPAGASTTRAKEARAPADVLLIAYNATYDEAAIETIARSFGLVVWGTPPSLFRKYAQAVKKRNPRIVNLFYRDLQAMHATYEDWKDVEQHEDWFLRDASGTVTLAHRDWKWHAMDLRSSGWVDHVAARIGEELQACGAWDGVFIDDVWTNCRDEFGRQSDRARALPDAAYARDFAKHTGAALERIKRSAGSRSVIANEDFTDGDYYRQCDGVMLEIFVHSCLSREPSVDPGYWRLSLDLLKRSGDLGKRFLAVSMIQEGATDEATEKVNRLCFATYLLGMHPGSAYCFQKNHFEVVSYPEWRLEIGKPVGEFSVRDGVFRREFEGALVVVNPEARRKALAFPRAYRVWGGDAVTSLTMEPQSGVVLIK